MSDNGSRDDSGRQAPPPVSPHCHDGSGGGEPLQDCTELARIVTCEECVRRGDRTILRDDTFNLPQPGYVGPEYRRTRVLLVGQNPGVSTPEFRERDEHYAAALRGVRDAPSNGTVTALQDVLEDIVPGWPVARHFPLADCGLRLRDIAYCNLVRCRTSGNAGPSTLMVRNCLDHFGRWLDWLQPAIVVCIGKWAHDRTAEELDRRGIPHAFINRQRNLSAAERQTNRGEVVELVRRVGGRNGPTSEHESVQEAMPGAIDPLASTECVCAGSPRSEGRGDPQRETLAAEEGARDPRPERELCHMADSRDKAFYQALFAELGIIYESSSSPLYYTERQRENSLRIYMNNRAGVGLMFSVPSSSRGYSREDFPQELWEFVADEALQECDRKAGYFGVKPRRVREREAFLSLLELRGFVGSETAGCATPMAAEEYIELFRTLGFTRAILGEPLRHPDRRFPELRFERSDEGGIYFRAYERDRGRFSDALWERHDPQNDDDPLVRLVPKPGKESEAFKRLLHTSGRITAMELRNFKGIGETPARVPLRPITLLFGANSAGKSTIIQAMYYAREVLGNRDPDPGKATLGGGSIDLGGFHALVHRHDLEREMQLKFEMVLVPDCLPGTEKYSVWKHPDGAQERTDVNDVLSIDSVWVDIQTIYDPNSRFMVERYGIGVNGQPLASIEQEEYYTGTFVSELNTEHALFHAMDSIFGEDGRPGEGWYQPFRAALDRHVLDVGGAHRRFFNIWMDDEVTPLPVWGRPYALSGDCEFRAELTESPVLAQFWALLNQLLICSGELLLSELGRVRHLGPIREIPPRSYTPARTPDASRWTTGLAAWDALMGALWIEGGVLNVGQGYLEHDSCSVGEVSRWLSSPALLDLGYSVAVEDYVQLPAEGTILQAIRELARGSGDSSKETVRAQILEPLEALPVQRKLKIVDLTRNVEVLPSDIGVGVSQVVPVVVGALDAASRIFLVEQPELHVHPRGQCRLADLFIDQVRKDNNRTFVLETHSEHLLLRIMRRMRETCDGRLRDGAPPVIPDHVSVLFVEEVEGKTVIRQMPLNERGELVKAWPGGFFEEGLEETWS